MDITIKTNKKENKKIQRETSKSIIFSVIILTYIFVFFVCFMIFKTEDLSPLNILIPSVFGLSATSLGFYSWKAKTENKIKLEIIRIREEQKLKRRFKDDNIKVNLNKYEDEEEVIISNIEEGEG